jgi:hypothetical protein
MCKKLIYFVSFVFVLAVTTTTSVAQVDIPVTNAGFEDPVLDADGWTWIDVPGWTSVGGEGPGIWHVTSADFDPVVAPEGQNVLYTENAVGDGAVVAQVLAETFAANTNYTLTVEVGNSYYYYFAGYSVQLLAGGTVIAEDNDTLWPDYLNWATSTVQYIYDSADSALVGQPLEIRLLNLGLDKDSPTDNTVGVEFDNVTLSYEAGSTVPELVAYWPLDDNANDTICGLNWTLDPNGTSFSADSIVGTGALRFDGISGEGRQDAVGPLIDAFTTKTVALWFRADSTSGIQALYDEGGATNGLAIRINEGTLQSAVRDASVQYTLTIPFDSTEWTEVAVSYDNGLLLLLVDGVEKATVMADFEANEVSSHSNNSTIGSTEQDAFGNNTTEPSDHFAGLMDDIRLYANALPVHIATVPIPADGAVLSSTPVDLFWTPGASAVSQDLYFGENFDEVDTGAANTFLALGQTAAGVDVPITVDDLIAETTYYWRIDAVDDANPDSPWKGQIWSFTLAPQTASDPSPTEGAMFVKPTTTLSWAPGLNSQSHTVYIGDNLDDVSNATGGTAQSEANYTPEAPLETGKIYYWRVDEFDGTDTHKGDIWSFETPPFTEIIDPNLVGWWKLDGEYLDLGYVFDYSGYNHHGTLRGDPQLVEGYDGNALDFDGDGDYVNVDGYKGILADENGVQQPLTVTAWVKTTDSGDRTIVSWGTSTNMIRIDFRLFEGRLRVEHGSGNRQGDTNLNDGEWHHVALTLIEGATISYPDVILWLDGSDDTREGTSANAFAITAGDDMSIGRRAHNDSRHFLGSLDDVRLYDKVLTDIELKIVGGFLESSNPDPADGAKIVDSLAILTWSPGPFAAEFDVYFGTNPEPGAAELVGRVSEATYIAAGLAEGQTYYWRVDDVEADGTTIHTGNVWSLWIPPKGAYNPNPADGQEVTDTEKDLSWDVDWSPVLSVVHFGTDVDQVTNTPVGFGPPLMEAGFDPGILEPGTTYYWRVDVFYGTWVTGEVWSFSTPAPKTVVFDFETDAQGWGGLKDGTAPTIVGETHAGGGSQSLCVTIDEAAHDQQEGGWASPRVFTVDQAAGGLSNLSFWYRVDDPDLNGGDFVLHWISSTEAWSGGGWYGNGLWGVLIADSQWHQQTADLSILGANAGGWEGTWGDQVAWEFRDDLLYSFEIAVSSTDNTSGSNIYIDDIVFSE